MPAHLIKEIDLLKKKLLTLSAMIEKNLNSAVSSITNKEKETAKRVIDKDEEIDEIEVEIEEECLKTLALYQPVAIDLRYIVAILKINSDLERIGDLAVNIAERSIFLADQKQVKTKLDFPGMAEKVQIMLKKCLDSLVNLDVTLAREVCAADDEVDEMNRQMYEQVKINVRTCPEDVDVLLHLLSISRHLERIADHATNVAEDVIYMVDGEIVRHKVEEFDS